MTASLITNDGQGGHDAPHLYAGDGGGRHELRRRGRAPSGGRSRSRPGMRAMLRWAARFVLSLRHAWQVATGKEERRLRLAKDLVYEALSHSTDPQIHLVRLRAEYTPSVSRLYGMREVIFMAVSRSRWEGEAMDVIRRFDALLGDHPGVRASRWLG